MQTLPGYTRTARFARRLLALALAFVLCAAGTATPAHAAGALLKTGSHDTYMVGTGTDTFSPEKVMNRAEAAVMLYSLLKNPPASAPARFSDVSASAWYSKQVNALAEVGVISGVGGGKYAPIKELTRAEFVTMMCGCMGLTSGSKTFTDVPASHWAAKYISAAADAGWVSGVGGGRFEPNRSLKRAEAVVIVNRATGRMDSGYAADKNLQKFSDVSKDKWYFSDVTEAASPEAVPIESGMTLRTTPLSGLNMRQSASSSSAVVEVLPLNSLLKATSAASGGWVAVTAPSGKSGYVSTDYVAIHAAKVVTGQSSAKSGTGSLSSTAITLHQYQSFRLDASVTGSITGTYWKSSNPSVADVPYTVAYNDKKHGAMVYGKGPGAAVLTFYGADGTALSQCRVTVTSPEPVRYAYAEENAPVAGKAFNLVAVTDNTKTAVTFNIGGQSYSCTSFTVQSHTAAASHGGTVNTVRVFTQPVTLPQGDYKATATVSGSGEVKNFTVHVASAASDVLATSTEERYTSTEMIKIIANFEGSVAEIADDQLARGNPTVGCGYVVPMNNTFYNNLTNAEMMGMLVDQVNNGSYAKAVNTFRKNNNIRMSQAQFDALVSFTYNCGPGVLSGDYYVAKVMLNAVQPNDALWKGTANVPGTLNNYGSNLYADKSLSSKVVCAVPSGAKVQVKQAFVDISAKTHEVWYYATYNGQSGYIPAGFVGLSGGYTRDLQYADSTALANNFLRWHTAGSQHYAGLIWRRMAECKVFFYGNYAEAYHSHPNYEKNTYQFVYPDCCKKYDKR